MLSCHRLVPGLGREKVWTSPLPSPPSLILYACTDACKSLSALLAGAMPMHPASSSKGKAVGWGLGAFLEVGQGWGDKCGGK